jgi:hypothetical protein
MARRRIRTRPAATAGRAAPAPIPATVAAEVQPPRPAGPPPAAPVARVVTPTSRPAPAVPAEAP